MVQKASLSVVSETRATRDEPDADPVPQFAPWLSRLVYIVTMDKVGSLVGKAGLGFETKGLWIKCASASCVWIVP